MENNKINNLENNSLSKEEIKRLERQEDFIRKSKEKFRDQFDYSKVNYIDNSSNIILKCKVHNKEFNIVANNHLHSETGGCPDCNKQNSLNNRKNLFIKNFKEKFGDFYDLSRVDYINSSTKIIIGCPVHGWIEDTPNTFLSKECPCPFCRKEHKKEETLKENSEKFFKIVNEKFKGKLDFSESVYLGSNKEITYKCLIHGVQKTLASRLLSSDYACPQCAIDSQRLTQEEFIKRAKSIHGDKYDYSEAVFVDIKTKVKIFCKECNEFFWMEPSRHIYGTFQGHNRCSGAYHKTPEEFKAEFESLLGDKFDFSLAQFKDNKTKVEIICRNCGKHFWKSPGVIYNSLKRTKSKSLLCPYCEGIHKISTEEFVNWLKEKYGEMYDYNKVNYIRAKTPITLICFEHGEFTRRPNDIKIKGGPCLCPVCNGSAGEAYLKNLFDTKNIEYCTQKTYKDLYRKESKVLKKSFEKKIPLKFDFYLPDYNLCIEYQGIQHFEAIEYWGGEQGLLENKEKDQIKKDYCKDNKISLLEIKYNISLDKIEELLNNYLEGKEKEWLEKPKHLFLAKDECVEEPY